MPEVLDKDDFILFDAIDDELEVIEEPYVNKESQSPKDLFRNVKKEYKAWDNVIELADYFKTFPPPEDSLKTNKATTINNQNTFVQSHLSIIIANNGNPAYDPYYQRLQKYYSYVRKQNTS